MDETPCYYDMASDQTLHFQEAKNVDGVDTGHKKSRFTTVMCISAHGSVVKSLIIFKGLKNVPTLNAPRNIEVAVSMGGSMNAPLIQKWIRCCFAARGQYFARTPSLLFMDSYGSHKKQEVLDCLKQVCNTEAILIPPRTTSFLQPLDVVVNASFKAALRRLWNEWLVDGEKEFTNKGYRKRPSYQALVDMVSAAMNSVNAEMMMKSFRCCGIAERGQEVVQQEHNERLKEVLAAGVKEKEEEGLQLSDGEESDEEELVRNEENGQQISEDESSEDEEEY